MSSRTKGVVLVTGGCGYIGSHVVLQLAKAGHEVIVLDNLSTGFADALKHGETLFVGDVGDEELLKRIFTSHRVAAVMHFAGKIRVEESMADPGLYYLENTVKPLRLWEACRRYGKPVVVFSSTAAVYGNPQVSPVSEEAPTAPLSPYGASKLMTERMLQDIAAVNDMRVAILRYFNVAGADAEGRIGQRTPQASHLIKVACETALGRRAEMAIHGDDYSTPDGTCIRDFIHVDDLATAHVLVLGYLLGGGGSVLLNCGYGHGYSVRDVVSMVHKVSGVAFPVRVGPRRPGDVVQMVACADKLRQLVNWTPRHDDLKTIITHAYAWDAKNPPQ